ncbi:dihydroorotase [Acidianus ambivalens]|uniref:Amidohydrolase family protein n=1 Tax=Acidianus ambivalens TaxID=2283 RepID=A0A650CX22_ACIAM|nr:amidohydrolase family protein [Acidianus ambivalens]MQL54414.1 amidohydrolase family protein [Acidianus ambivalens]QGR22235.1 amidohydrolase family protein [Acidianus ambivalens]
MIIKEVKIITENGIIEGDVKIEGSKIVKVSKVINEREELINGHGKLLLPGGIDNHVHIFKRYLKVPTSDTVRKSTIAAAFGGTTTVIDFAFSDRSPSVEERIEQFKDSFVNYSFHIFASDVTENLINVLKSGFKSVKFMMIEYAGIKSSLSGLIRINDLVRKFDGYIMVHAEDEDLIKSLAEGKKGDPKLHLITRPEETELSAVLRAKAIVDKGVIAHVSSGKTLDIIEGKLLGEVVLHHLILSKEVYDRKDSYLFVTSPPVRNPEELWSRINKIFMIATDHNWFDKEVKEQHREFPDLVPGLPGIELRVPMIITEFIKRNLPLSLAVKLLSENPAKLNRLNKGKIEEGYDADLVIYNQEKKWKISVENTHMADWTPYEGYEVIGKPDTVIINGKIVIENEEIKDDSFTGKLVK